MLIRYIFRVLTLEILIIIIQILSELSLQNINSFRNVVSFKMFITLNWFKSCITYSFQRGILIKIMRAILTSHWLSVFRKRKNNKNTKDHKMCRKLWCMYSWFFVYAYEMKISKNVLKIKIHSRKQNQKHIRLCRPKLN